MRTFDYESLVAAVDDLRSTHGARSCREAWSRTLAAVESWGSPAMLRRLVREARRDLIRDRSADWCRAAAALLDSIDESRRWTVVDFAAVGLLADDVVGLWSPGLPAALRHEGVDAPDAAVLVNVAVLVRPNLPTVCGEAPTDLGMADKVGGMLVAAIAIHEAAHAIVASSTTTIEPTLPMLRAAVPMIRDIRRDHHDARWAWATMLLTARAARGIVPTERDWPGWLWDAIEQDAAVSSGVPSAAIVDAVASATRRPWHHDPAGDPPAALVDLFKRRDAA